VGKADTQQISFAQKYFEENGYVYFKNCGWLFLEEREIIFTDGRIDYIILYVSPPESMWKYRYDKPIRHK
jgi:hypothetical protein